MALRNHLCGCRNVVTLFGQPRRFQSCKEDLKMCREPGFLGRDFIDPTEFTSIELKELLWTALDLKCIMKNRKCLNFDLCAGKSVTLLMARPCIKSQMAIPNAVAMLGAKCNVYIDKEWEHAACVPDIGRFLATQSDLIFTLGDHHAMTCGLADGSRRPVIGILTGKFAPLKGLVDMMTAFEHFGRLKKLTMGYVGPTGPLLNTYLTMLPRLGMDLRFTTSCAPPGDGKTKCPSLMDVSLKSCQQNNTGLRECPNVADAIYRADIAATTFHRLPGLRITMKEMKTANPDWVLLHSLPRTDIEVSSDVFYDKRCLAFDCAGNTIWVAMALVLRMLREYEPKIKKPDFDGDMYCV